MLVYDLGMNNGDDCRYYLAKGCKVVAVEANPFLCEQVSGALAEHIPDRLTIVNKAVSDKDGEEVEFYIDLVNHVRSTMENVEGRQTQQVKAQTVRLPTLIREHGMPDFLKIDIEFVDHLVLADMIKEGIKPAMISCEAHRFEILLLLWKMGYKEFRLVNGKTVHRDYGRMPINRIDGTTVKHRFPRHCAGPFADDLPTKWREVTQAAKEWLNRHELFGKGWYDIHAR